MLNYKSKKNPSVFALTVTRANSRRDTHIFEVSGQPESIPGHATNFPTAYSSVNKQFAIALLD